MRICSGFFIIVAALYASAAYPDFVIKADADLLTIYDDAKPVMVYHCGMTTPPQGVDPGQARACYFHPVYGLDGDVLTEDYPSDHYHHRGLFWAWPLSRYGERPVDIWLLKGIRQRWEAWLKLAPGPDAAEVELQNIWSFDDAPNEPIIRETVRFVVRKAEQDSRAIDFHITITNTGKEIFHLQGASTDAKGYGGFCFRPDTRRRPLVFTTEKGVLHEDATSIETRWADASSPAVPDGPVSGVSIFQHPQTAGYPHTGWLLRDYAFLGASWPHTKGCTLEPGQSFDLRYRLFIHRGSAEEALVAEHYETYLKTSGAHQAAGVANQ